MNEDKNYFDNSLNTIIVSDDKRFSFEITYESPDGKKLVGTFVSKVPSIKDIIKVSEEQCKMLKEFSSDNVPVEAHNYSYMYATLLVCLVSYPDWFLINDPDKLYDINLLGEIYRTHKDAVDRFRESSIIRIKGAVKK
jgi:hypothetical protein